MRVRRKKDEVRPDIREIILDATQKLMTSAGYAAVSTRAVAKAIEMTPGAIHYYFPTTDELLVALFRRAARDNRRQLEATLASENPLAAIWLSNFAESGGTALTLEFIALANHRKSIRAEIRAYAEEIRLLQAEAIARLLRGNGLDDTLQNALGLSALASWLPTSLIMETGLGIELGHEEAKAIVERLLSMLMASQSQLDVIERDAAGIGAA
jgi:AcrR family transcriptional regulator